MTRAAVFPPMPASFKDGEVDAKAIASNVPRWMRAGARLTAHTHIIGVKEREQIRAALGQLQEVS